METIVTNMLSISRQQITMTDRQGQVFGLVLDREEGGHDGQK